MQLERIRVDARREGFEAEGAPFFYFADTAWSAFTNLGLEEWKDYVDRRAAQGFNFLQINLLPQWDRSGGALELEPFESDGRGGWDWTRPRDAYFRRIDDFLGYAAGRGLRPALVLLWCDFVPGTWGSAKRGGPTMPLEAVGPYVEFAARRFARFAPVYLASGDTDYGPASIPHYAEALRAVKRADPGALTTLHSQPDADLPPELYGMEELDFYMYQSGHVFEEQRRTWEWPRRFAAYGPRRPIVNGEPCYDGHKHGNRQGRFDGLDIRRAFFQSVLCGAKAGFTYGAHGVWNFHRPGQEFPSTQFSGTPYGWRTALRFAGAWDAAGCVRLFEDFGLGDLVPLADAADSVEPWFLAATPDRDRFALYLPAAAPAELPYDFSGYRCRCCMLASRRTSVPRLAPVGAGCRLSMEEAEGDILILGSKR